MASRTARRCAAALNFRFAVTAVWHSTSLWRTRAGRPESRGGGRMRSRGLAEASDGALAPSATPLSVGSGQTHPFTDVMVFEELPVVEETTVVVAP